MKKESSPLKVAIPTAALTLLGPVAAFAAEGTGRVSDIILIIRIYMYIYKCIL